MHKSKINHLKLLTLGQKAKKDEAAKVKYTCASSCRHVDHLRLWKAAIHSSLIENIMGTTQNVTYSCAPPTAKSYADCQIRPLSREGSCDKFESKICNAKTVSSGAACLSHKVVCSWGSDIFKEFDSYETASYVFTL